MPGSRLTDRSVANIIKAYAGRAGFDASTFSGHSLRSGFLTSAGGKGASIFKMMDVSRHKSMDTLRGYVRDAELFKDHAGARVALSNPVHGVDHSSDVSQTSHHIRKVPDSDSRIYSAETSVGPLRPLKVAGGATPGS